MTTAEQQTMNNSGLAFRQLLKNPVFTTVAGKPAILPADRPSGKLASKNGEAVMQLMAELHREGTTVRIVRTMPASQTPRDGPCICSTAGWSGEN